MKGTVVSILCLALLVGGAAPDSSAASRERKLLSTAKTTIYGALLGSLLGLATSLVVRDGYKDDAVRWGIVLGAFGGFVYGVTEQEEDDLDLLSARPPAALPLCLERSRSRMPGTFFGAPSPGRGKDGYGGQQEEGGCEEALAGGRLGEGGQEREGEDPGETEGTWIQTRGDRREEAVSPLQPNGSVRLPPG